LQDSRFITQLARLVADRPRTVLLSLLVISIALGLALPRLSADSSPRALLASADPEQERREAETRGWFGSSNNTVVVVLSAEDALALDVLQYEHRLASALSSLPEVERVDALTRVQWPQRDESEETLDELAPSPPEQEDPATLDAASALVAAAPEVFPLGLVTLAERRAGMRIAPLVAGDEVRAEDAARLRTLLGTTTQLDRRLISRDRKHLLVAVQLSDALQSHREVSASVERIEAWLAAHPAPASVEVTLSGLPVLRTSLVRHMRADQRVLIPGTLLASFVVLALSFRWAPAVLLPLLSVGVTALWLLGAMALAGEPLNVLNNMLPALVIIIGLNEAVHIIGRYAEEAQRDGDKKRALRRTVRAMGAACLTTTATSAVGLLALVVSRTEMLRRFGLVGACGLLLAYAVTLLVVPATLSLLRAPPSLEKAATRGRIEGLLTLVTRAALRRPWLSLSVAAVSALAASAAAEQLSVDTALLDQFSPRDPIHQGVRLLEREFEGVRPLEITLSSAKPGRMFDPALLTAMREIATWARAQPGVLGVSDPSDPLLSGWALVADRPRDVRELHTSAQVRALRALLAASDPRLVAPLLTEDGAHARIRVRLRDIGSHGTGSFVARARQLIARKLDGVDGVEVAFAGDAYLGSRGLDAVVSDLSGSVLLAALMIFLLLWALLRDLPLALLAVPANLLPQVWTMGWMAVRGIPLNASSAIIFSLSIGLAVDGSIHLVSRFQEERARTPLVTTALLRAVRGSGRNIVISSCALVLGFSAMLLSNFVPVRRFAELITVSMAGSVIATLWLQPVLLRLFLTRKPIAVPRTAPT